MKCKYLPLLNRYADNELSRDERSLIEAHIQTCPVCAQEIKYIQLMKQCLGQNKIESNPDVFWQTLKDRLQDEVARDEQERLVIDLETWVRKLMPVPVVIAVVAVIFFYLMPAKQNVIDEYVFGTNFSNVSSLIEEPAGQSGAETLLY